MLIWTILNVISKSKIHLLYSTFEISLILYTQHMKLSVYPTKSTCKNTKGSNQTSKDLII